MNYPNVSSAIYPNTVLNEGDFFALVVTPPVSYPSDDSTSLQQMASGDPSHNWVFSLKAKTLDEAKVEATATAKEHEPDATQIRVFQVQTVADIFPLDAVQT